ncbi:hypothetical protein AB0B89_27895, partial [Sphaerisporangium sp. NPDC049002]|uniref:hypothetical protein n=1 Tax=Sphaerisporangium sp. NPDC049002 TaxID=3155392 RepID=UPI0033EC5630
MELSLVTRRVLIAVRPAPASIAIGDGRRSSVRALTGTTSSGRDVYEQSLLLEGVHVAVSRRRFMTSVVSGSALAAVSSSQLVSALTSAASAASPVGDVVGKITVGYQGWFAAPGDGAPINGWWHWSANMGQPPSPSNTT